MLNHDLEVALQATRRASSRLMRDFQSIDQLHVSDKGISDFVTSADIGAESAILSVLKEEFPDFGFIMEEKGRIPGIQQDCYWIIDPLDGTSNFMNGISYFATTIAMSIDNQIEICVSEIPCTKDIYYASIKSGAFHANCYGEIRAMHTNKIQDISNGIILLGSLRPRNESCKNILCTFISRSLHVRCIGSSVLSLCHVASGKAQAFVSIKPKIWDVAAGILLVKESGGVIVEYKNCFIAACNKIIARQIISIIDPVL